MPKATILAEEKREKLAREKKKGTSYALAITLERRVRNNEFRDYAELARLAGITRARMTQITKLLDLAPDIQEELLFMPPTKRVTERNLRPVAAQIAWPEQRRLFTSMLSGQPASKHIVCGRTAGAK